MRERENSVFLFPDGFR